MSGMDTTRNELIVLEDLEKVFQVRRKAGRFRRTRTEVRAVDGISFTVRRGEMVGYIGPNGAGKSTTTRILLGMLRADTGAARLLGGDPWHD
ncbi:ATP-binding cassette domain-containing protein, partial [Rhodococcus sp. NPDC054953]